MMWLFVGLAMLSGQASAFPSAFWNQRVALVYTVQPTNVLQGLCSSLFRVQHQRNGMPTNVSSDLTVSLSSSSGTTVFYSDSLCTIPITNVSILAGSNSAEFFALDPSQSNINVTASSGATGVVDGIASVSVDFNSFRWTGLGANANWSNGDNWSGGAAPSTNSQIAVFDGSCSSNCSPVLTGAVAIGGIRMNSGFTGSINQGALYDITLTGQSFVMTAGSFVGSSDVGRTLNIDNASFVVAGGSFTLPAGTLRASNSYEIRPAATVVSPGTTTLHVRCSSGWSCAGIGLSSSASLLFSSDSYGTVQISGRDTTYNLNATTLRVNGQLIIGDTLVSLRMVNNGIIEVNGNLTHHLFGYRGTARIVLKGNAGGQTVQGFASQDYSRVFPAIEIDTGSNPVTLTDFVFTHDFRIISSGAIITTSSTFGLICGLNTTSNVCRFGTMHMVVPAGVSFNNMVIRGFCSDINLNGSNLTVLGNLRVGDSTDSCRTQSLNNGTINLNGDLLYEIAGYRGTGRIILKGNVSGQSVFGPTSSDLNLFFPRLEIDTGTYSVSLFNIITTEEWTVTSVGALIAGTSNLRVRCHIQGGTTGSSVIMVPSRFALLQRVTTILRSGEIALALI